MHTHYTLSLSFFFFSLVFLFQLIPSKTQSIFQGSNQNHSHLKICPHENFHAQTAPCSTDPTKKKKGKPHQPADTEKVICTTTCHFQQKRKGKLGNILTKNGYIKM